jgi:thioredoxin 1
MAMSVNIVTDGTFEAEVLGADRPVLVEFTAEWCPPCRMLAPILQSIAEEESERLAVAVIDVDENPKTTQRYGVLSMPTLMVFRNGEPVKSMVGARPKSRLLHDIADVIEGGSPS